MLLFFSEQNKSFSREKKGLTLIEILVAVLIATLLTAAISVTITSARKKAGDNRSKYDLRDIVNALELKYNDLGRYPDLPDSPTKIGDTTILAPYLNSPPTGNGRYYWYDDNNSQKFCVYFQLEADPSKYFSCSHKGCVVGNNICPNF